MSTILSWLPIKLPKKDVSDAVKRVRRKCAGTYGRCRICDRIRTGALALEGRCTCCPKCWNRADKCVCCEQCADPKNACDCLDRMIEIWGDRGRECMDCACMTISPLRYVENTVTHSGGTPCPLCCIYCTNPKRECTCCGTCRTTPCICCIDCGDVRIKCKCYSVKFLSHYLKHARVYQDMVRFLPENCFLKHPDEDD
jgi:hypothetical protein